MKVPLIPVWTGTVFVAYCLGLFCLKSHAEASGLAAMALMVIVGIALSIRRTEKGREEEGEEEKPTA